MVTNTFNQYPPQQGQPPYPGQQYLPPGQQYLPPGQQYPPPQQYPQQQHPPQPPHGQQHGQSQYNPPAELPHHFPPPARSPQPYGAPQNQPIGYQPHGQAYPPGPPNGGYPPPLPQGAPYAQGPGYGGPPPPTSYNQPPPHQHSYQAPPYGAPQQQYMHGQPPVHAGNQPYGAPFSGYGTPQQYGTPTPQPTTAQYYSGAAVGAAAGGYGGAVYGAPSNSVPADIVAIKKACRGFGTDKKTLINILANRDGPTIDAIRNGFRGKGLIKELQEERLISGDFGVALLACARGPIDGEAYWVECAIAGLGTNETMLTEAIMCKHSHEIKGMKNAYYMYYRSDIVKKVAADLSGETRLMFEGALESDKTYGDINTDTHTIKVGSYGSIYELLTKRNPDHIFEVAHAYEAMNGKGSWMRKLEDIPGLLPGSHMQKAIIYIGSGAIDRPKRDAELLEDSMKGLGTQDQLLISRLIRMHWNRPHFEKVKQKYMQLYGKSLYSRVKSETSGSYEDLLLAIIGD